MNAIPGTITGATVVKRAGDLKVGDVIPGREDSRHTVEFVSRPFDHAVMGMTVTVVTREITGEEWTGSLDHYFRVGDRYHVEA